MCKHPNVKIDKSEAECKEFSTTWMYLPTLDLEDCYIQTDTLTKCIEKMEIQPIGELVQMLNDEYTDIATKEILYKEYGFNTYHENHIKKLYGDYYNVHKDEIISSEGYSYFYEQLKVLYYLKYDNIIKELEKVQDFASENDVEECWT